MPGISAILTAAGESTRMGRPKPLLPWHGVPLLQYQLRSLTQAGVAEVVVVLGHDAQITAPYATGPRTRFAVNPDYRRGKTTSIRAGLEVIDPDASDILLLAVDQPRTAALISTIIGAHVRHGALITSPRFEGHGGHPLIFSSALREELERISEERQGIREVFQSHRGGVTEVRIDDPLVRLDLNTPEVYEEAKQRFGA